TCRRAASRLWLMAHIYMTFDFGTDEERAQQARHKLEMWKQAFRLDKKLLYRFERPGAESAVPEEGAPEAAAEKTAKPGRRGKAAGKGKRKKASGEDAEGGEKAPQAVRLHLRLAFSGHEKMTEERWRKRIPSEEPFKGTEAQIVQGEDAGFAEAERTFDALE